MERELFRLDEISWRGLCEDLIRNLWMILLTAVTVWLAVGGVHNIIYEPEYTASSTLVVSSRGSGSAYSSLAAASQMADVFGQVFQSEALRNKIIEDVGAEIEGTISCSPIEETNLLVLSTTCPDPRQAYLFINSALEHYEEVAGNVFSNASLEVVQEPEVPSAPSNTSWIMSHRYLLTLLGALGMAAVICMFYVLRFTVKNEVGGARQLDGTIRGVIPYERKTPAAGERWSLFRNKGAAAGKKGNPKQALLLNSPVVTMDFAEATRNAQARVEHHMRRNRQKALLVISITENEGKSTVAANLALALAEKRRKVLLVDGDLRKPAQHKVFEVNEKGRESLDKVLSGEVSWREALRFSRQDRIWELFQFRPAARPAAVMNVEALTGLMEEWRREFDYIIVDCSPAAVSTDAEIWMEAVDSVLLVVREDRADIRVINDMVDTIWQSGRDFAGFILNGFHREWFRGMSGYGSAGSGYSRYGKSRRDVEERG